MNRFLWWGPLVALFAIAGYVSAGESTDVKELLERMKKMESKMADQEKTIKDLRAGGEVKATASQQVDKALSNSASSLIFHDPSLHKRAIKIGGNLDVSYQYAFNQPDVPRPQYNMERGFDAMDNNDFNVHMAKIFFDGTAKEKGQAGFRIDLAFGSDAQRISSYGEGPNWTDGFDFGGSGTEYTESGHKADFSLGQAYIDYIIPVANGIRMKVGKFATPFGFEVIEAQNNWNATRSFNFVHGVPATHTGIAFEYQVFSNWQVSGYLVNGWDNSIDNNEGKSGILQSKWSPTDWITWTVSGMVGNEQSTSVEAREADYADEHTRYLVNTVATFKPWEKWEFAAEGTFGMDEGENNDRAHQPYVKNAKWWGAAGYLKYSFLPGWYLAARGEYFNDDGATRTTYGNRFGWSGGGFPVQRGGGGGNVELYSGTVTMSYSPVSPFEIRLEYRYDAASVDEFISKEYKPNGGDWHRDGNIRDRVNTQDTLTVQFLYKF
jgi:hypothetical protein